MVEQRGFAATKTETETAGPTVRQIDRSDLKAALSAGLSDFYARPTHVIFLCLIYPVVAILLIRVAFGYDMLPLVFPLISGFTLVGPLAATGLYELSRRREKGLDYAWWHVFDVVRSPAVGSLATLGVVMAAIFVGWLQAALLIYGAFFGDAVPQSVGEFTRQVFFTEAGWGLILVGCGVGFVFAAVVLAISVVSLPILLHKNVGVLTAVLTSIRAVMANPQTMAAWGLIVAVSLLIGSIPFFVGLAIVLPVLGHATWHLYRRVIEW